MTGPCNNLLLSKEGLIYTVTSNTRHVLRPSILENQNKWQKSRRMDQCHHHIQRASRQDRAWNDGCLDRRLYTLENNAVSHREPMQLLQTTSKKNEENVQTILDRFLSPRLQYH